MNLILQAATFARDAHFAVLRKYTSEPYILHPMRVAGMVSLVPGVTQEVVAAGWLHDVVEDCPAQRVHFYAKFTGYVVTLVDNLTNKSLQPEFKRPNREARKKIDRDYIASCDLWTQILKLTDRLDNLLDMVDAERGFRRLYCNESVLLAEALQPNVDFTIGPGADSRVVELQRLCKAVIHEGQRFF